MEKPAHQQPRRAPGWGNRRAWQVIGSAPVLAVVLTVVFAVDPWGRYDSISQRAELPEYLCAIFDEESLEELLPEAAEVQSDNMSLLPWEQLSCRVERNPDDLSLAIDGPYLDLAVQRFPDPDTGLQRAGNLFRNECALTAYGWSSQSKSFSESVPVGDDECGEIEVIENDDVVAVELLVLDGPDVVEVNYRTPKDADDAEQIAVRLATQLIEKLRHRE